jgi:hypothetical protein
VTDTLSTGRKLPIADPSMRELEGYTLMMIGVRKKMRSLITPERGKLIKDGLIKKQTNISGKKDSGARLD